MAALLACGDDAILSHGSAAALWGIGPEWRLIEVTVRHRGWSRLSGVKVRSRPVLPRRRHHGPPRHPGHHRAAHDSRPGGDSDLRRLARAPRERSRRRQRYRLRFPALRRYCDLRPASLGSGACARLLDPETFRLSDSELERLFRPLALAAGFPQPLTKAIVNGYEVDFYWPDLGLVVETDSLRYHRNAIKQSRDLLRDQVHTAAGLTTLRFTHWQVAREPRHVEAILAATRAVGLRALTRRL